MNSQIFEPPSSDVSLPPDNEPSTGHSMPMSLSQGRISPERRGRPASPTKGLGGFVQSAMLKRSDSVSKRWSAQPSTGLSRGNSIASNRSGYDGSQYGAPKSQAPNRFSREPSPMARSRPSSSQGDTALAQVEIEYENPGASGTTSSTAGDTLSNGFAKPALPHNTTRLAARERVESASTSASQEFASPSSPSKKWSPTKASWLENAINKPDSPKPKVVPPSQPVWMASVNQAKQQRGSVDIGKGNTFKEVSVGGLLRSPPMGAGQLPESSGASTTIGNIASKPKTRDSDGVTIAGKESGIPAADLISKASSTSLSEVPVVAENIEPSSKEDLQPSGPLEPLQDFASELTRQTFGSPISKSKPETPPKKDFRSALKPRQVSGGKKINEEPEFKAAFGKLKRTHTQNYVAPDELKDNILRGKSGLVVTGGPKKSERRDDFKESLLKQKEAMKAGTPPAVGRKPSGGNAAKSEDAPIPEAIAKRKGLLSSESGLSNRKPETASVSQQPKALAEFKRLQGKPQLAPAEQPSALPSETKKDQPVNGKLGKDFNSSLAGIISRGPIPPSDSSKPSLTSNDESTRIDSNYIKSDRTEKSSEGPQLTHMTKARAKGPKRRLPTKGKASKEEQSVEQIPDPTSSISYNSKAEQRSVQETPSPQSTGINGNFQSHPLNAISNNDRRVSQPKPPRKPSTNISQPTGTPKAPDTATPTAAVTSQQPTPPSSKPNYTSAKLEKPREVLPKSSGVDNPPKKPAEIETQEDSSKFVSAHTQVVHQKEVQLPSVKSATALWGKDRTKEKPSTPRSRSPIKLPSRADEESAMENAGLTPAKQKPFGLGIDSTPKEPSTSTINGSSLPTPPLNSPRSPPLPAKKPASIANRVISNTIKPEPKTQNIISPSSQPSEAARIFTEIFEEAPNKPLKTNVNTPAVLAARVPHQESDKIRTLRKQIWEISGGGKLIPVSADQSHILFEESLYICHHVFGNTAGTRTTEVYLWCGDGVAASATEDAQLFARKQAKDHNGKLIVLKQGKETPHFFQAFDGIIITRYGQSDRASKRYMLCGRRHIGQIAFDEVDFSPRSLCKGFTYILSPGTGKLHLWKGRGSSADEIGCARLIGNDLGAGGDVEEADDGREPEGFWKLFTEGHQALPSSSSPSAEDDAKYWHLKPSCEHYTTRLYQVDIEPPRPKSSGSGFMDRWGRRGSAPASAEDNGTSTAQIREIVPFAQSDIFEDGVFVLDAFFEVFVYVLPSFSPSSTLFFPLNIPLMPR